MPKRALTQLFAPSSPESSYETRDKRQDWGRRAGSSHSSLACTKQVLVSIGCQAAMSDGVEVCPIDTIPFQLVATCKVAAASSARGPTPSGRLMTASY